MKLRTITRYSLAVALIAPAAGALAAEYASAASETAPANEESSSVEVVAAPVVIESGVLNPDPTLDQLMQKFRTALGQPSVSSVSERRLANGRLEVTTSRGRFCTAPLPGYIQSGLGGDTTLVAPCALF